jgi:hypothetical protein
MGREAVVATVPREEGDAAAADIADRQRITR